MALEATGTMPIRWREQRHVSSLQRQGTLGKAWKPAIAPVERRVFKGHFPTGPEWAKKIQENLRCELLY
jgi:hypothetical protein